jgi:hypothetical protein
MAKAQELDLGSWILDFQLFATVSISIFPLAALCAFRLRFGKPWRDRRRETPFT